MVVAAQLCSLDSATLGSLVVAGTGVAFSEVLGSLAVSSDMIRS